MTSFGEIQAEINGITFGSVDANGVQWRLTGLDGWGSPASSLQLTQKPRGQGAFQSIPPYLTPRTLAPAGKVWAPDFDAASAALDELCAAFTLSPSQLTVTEGSRTRYVTVQRQDETIATWQTDTQFDFSAQVVAADPRKYATSLAASTFLPASSGGLQIPFTIPFTIASTLVSGTCSLTNPGNITGPVTLQINGPCTGPIVTHVSSGAQLVFASSLVLNAGEFLVIDMEAQTALANGQSSRNGYINQRGWSGFDPGVNVWAFSAVAYSSLSELLVTAWPTWQ